MSDWNEKVIEEFRSNGGTVETMGFGRRLVLLHHTGARSGTERVAPLAAIRDGEDRWFIAASKAGAPTNPDWFHNLRAHPDTRIETPDDGTVEVTAVVLEGAERDAAWERFKDMSDGFRSYEEKTTRVIPVVALERRGD
ncbi:nitroreductase/quinone reductase family protein [Phycicoccus flavus]|uniref:nitroreductase/quinone reductase family protein n=1 Tax=Phycicoccus flavus TaxID=2502783 RepID=UPI000FEB6EEE|nr:nitroreductase/quinone reductase family protein [Phycicoccus flavus]NHA68154.1 nitroreductase family deazaflavin-dependent oxidoreductase [Phycicoccus flavus]